MFKTILAILILIFSCVSSAVTIQAKSWLIADGDGTILEYENVHTVQPIASITKLMTAMVVLDSNDNLNEIIKLKKFKGANLTRQQLINLAIIHSDNAAADMLCKSYRFGYNRCIDEMNHKAAVIGMVNTRFYDSTGLDNRNVSSAAELIKLLQAAERYPEIVNASNQSVIELVKKKKGKWRFTNTNPLVAKYNVIVSKTGYVRASGGCLAMSAYVDGKKKLFVVLNSKTTRTRIYEMEHLILSTVGS
jgi:serine-type D-Ala-D-Ala endopeptidase (penicillin-binding protein 7)